MCTPDCRCRAKPYPAVGPWHRQEQLHLYIFGFSFAIGDKVTFFTSFHNVENSYFKRECEVQDFCEAWVDHEKIVYFWYTKRMKKVS
jgi:hypothetical protein